LIRFVNDAGFALVQKWEGLVLVAERDIAGVWTIGYGHTVGVAKGQTITWREALQLLEIDLASVAGFVDARGLATDNQFAAMVSLAFNIGNSGFLGSTVLRQHKAHNFASAADAFLLWDKAHVDGRLVEVQGLLNRRHDERALYLTP
jgi:lysozyme